MYRMWRGREAAAAYLRHRLNVTSHSTVVLRASMRQRHSLQIFYPLLTSPMRAVCRTHGQVKSSSFRLVNRKWFALLIGSMSRSDTPRTERRAATWNSGGVAEQTAIISLHNINWLVFITETECVYCAVRTGSLYTASLTFSNSTFCPHSVFRCFVWIWEQTVIISLYSINWLVFITETECVYCAVRAA